MEEEDEREVQTDNTESVAEHLLRCHGSLWNLNVRGERIEGGDGTGDVQGKIQDVGKVVDEGVFCKRAGSVSASFVAKGLDFGGNDAALCVVLGRDLTTGRARSFVLLPRTSSTSLRNE